MRKNLTLAVKIVVSVTLLYLAFRKIDITNVGSRIYDVNLSWLAAALALSVAQLILSTHRWRVIALLCGVTVAFSRAFRFIWIGTFFNQTLPSSVGGDAVRVWLLVRDGWSWSSSAYSVLLDRMIGMFALSVFVVASLGWAFALITNPVARLTLSLIGFGTIAGFFVFTLLRHIRHAYLTRWRAVRHLVQLSTLAGDTIFSLRSGPTVSAVSLGIQFLLVLTVWCLGWAANARFDLLQATILIPPLMLISTLPVSIAGWGVRESAFALAFSYVGLSQTDGIIISLLFGASMAALGLVGGIVWLATPHNTPQSKPAQDLLANGNASDPGEK
jgi:uncharacterized protein (TIRG00374 family)